MTAPGYPRLLASMATAITAGAVVLAWRRIIRVEVQGASMAPTMHDGDRLVALGRLRGRPGDIVAVRDPRMPSRILVKRVSGVEDDHSLRVSGDNPHASTDSRTFGPVPPALVVGRVVWCYWPPPRRGAVPRTHPRKGRPGRYR